MALEDLLARADLPADLRAALVREVAAIAAAPDAPREGVDRLRASERCYRALFDGSRDAIITVDVATGAILDANSQAETLLGRSRDELIGLPHTALHPPEMAEMCRRLLQERSRDRAAPPKEVFVVSSSGERIPVEIRDRAIELEPGRLIMQGLFIDLRERQEAEQALRDSERRFRSLHEAMTEGVCVQEIIRGEAGEPVDYRFVEANPSFSEIAGFPRGRVPGVRASELYGVEEPPFLDIYAQVVESGSPTRFETRFPPRGRHVRVSVFSPGPGLCAAVLEDLSDRAPTVASVDEAEAGHRFLFEEMAQGVICQEADGRISAANPAAERILGMTLAQMNESPRPAAVREDGSPFPREDHPASVALRTGREVRDVLMGAYHPIDLQYRWLVVSAVPQFRPGQERPFRAFATFTDVTELRETRVRLEQSLVFNREIISSAGEGIVVYDNDLRYMVWNPFMEHLTGLPARQVLGRNALDMFPHLREQGADRLLAEALAGRAVTSPEMPFRVPQTGEQGWVVSTYAPHRNSRGQVTGVIATIRNVTAQRAAEERSRIQRDLAAALLRTSSLEEALGLCLRAALDAAELDCGGAYTIEGATGGATLMAHTGLSEEYVNAFRSVTGCRMRLLEGEAPVYATPEDASLEPPYMELLRHEGLRSIALVPVRQRGSLVACLCAGSRCTESFAPPARESLEAIAALMGSVVARFAAERSLRDSERLLRESQEVARLGSYILDAPTGIWTSTAVLDSVFGIDDTHPKSIDGWLALVHPDDRQAMEAYLAEALESGTVFDRTYRIIRAHDGAERWVKGLGSFQYDDSGAAIRMQGTIQDITDLKESEESRLRLEAQLQRTQRLESLGVMAGGIAHDFNNILAAILGFSEMAIEAAEASPEARGHMEEVLAGAERARDLVNQILAFSRQAGMEVRPLHLDSLLKEALKLVRASTPANIAIQQEIDPAAGPVSADASQIHQVIVNLCANAQYAMREQGGVLSIGLQRVALTSGHAETMGLSAPGAYVCLSVADTGCGIDPATRDRIFEPFFTTKPVGEGTGLGLATSHGIIASHGGTIVVESEPGGGSVFRVYFPMAEAPADRDTGRSSRGPVPKGEARVLFVDDEAALAAMAERMLSNLGYAVTAATEPERALEILAASPEAFDIVLTDQTMPKMAGLELAAWVREMRPDLPVVIMTGFASRVDPEVAAALAIREVVRKPYSRRELAEAIDRALHEPERG